MDDILAKHVRVGALAIADRHQVVLQHFRVPSGPGRNMAVPEATLVVPPALATTCIRVVRPLSGYTPGS